MKFKYGGASVFTGVGMILYAAAASADVFTVTNLGEGGTGSLRAANDQANANPGPDTIDFDTSQFPGDPPWTIDLTSGDLVIDDSTQIKGPGPDKLTVRRGTEIALFRVFTVTPGAKAVVIHGLTVQNGKVENTTGPSAGGGLSVGAGATVIVNNAIFDGNEAAGADPSGGAIVNNGTLTVTRSLFTNNQTPSTDPDQGHGGAIRNNGTLNARFSVFTGNSSLFGGAIYNAFGANARINENSITQNNAPTGLGGGIQNDGTIVEFNGNGIGNNSSFGGTDLNNGLVGTVNNPSGNIMTDPDGHDVDEAPNNFIVPDVELGPLLPRGGPKPGVLPSSTSPLKDQNSDPLGYNFDYRGGFRTVEGVQDVGALETGNRFFLAATGMPAAWGDSGNWLELQIPGPDDPVFITNNNTADLTGAGPVHVGCINVGMAGDIGPVSGHLVGDNPDLTVDNIEVGSAYAQLSPFVSGHGTMNLNGGSLNVTNLYIARNATLPAEDEIDSTLESDGEVTILNAEEITVTGSTVVGRSELSGEGSDTGLAISALTLSADSASLGSLSAASAFAEKPQMRAEVQADVSVNVVNELNTNNVSLGLALSFGGEAVIPSATATLQADAINSRGTTIGSGQLSGSDPGMSHIGDLHFYVIANDYTITNGALTVASASATGPGYILIEDTIADITTQTFMSSGLITGTILGSNPDSETLIENAKLTLAADESTINGPVSVGSMSISGDVSGTIENARLYVEGGTFTVNPAFAGFPALSVTPINAFVPAGTLQSTGMARFVGVNGDIEGDVHVAVSNVVGVASDSFADGSVIFRESDFFINGDFRAAINDGSGDMDLFATIVTNPSFLDIAGNLELGGGATLEFHVEGLLRPASGVPGEYGAIDAANAMLDGDLSLVFDFPGVQLGDMFELIRLDPAGMFTGSFDDLTVAGLPPGLTATTEFQGQSLFATVIVPEPASITLLLGLLSLAHRRPGR